MGSSGWRISARTPKRRTLVAMRWAYWPPKSMTAMVSCCMGIPEFRHSGRERGPRGLRDVCDPHRIRERSSGPRGGAHSVEIGFGSEGRWGSAFSFPRREAGEPEVTQDPGQKEEEGTPHSEETELHVHDVVHLLHQGSPGSADGQVALDAAARATQSRDGKEPVDPVQIRSRDRTTGASEPSGSPGKPSSATAPTESARVKSPRGKRTSTGPFLSRTVKVYPAGNGSLPSRVPPARSDPCWRPGPTVDRRPRP